MFYLYRDGATLGPFSDQELREAFQRGELAGAVVCLVGAQSWVSPEVAFGAQASSEPAPPAPQAPPVREAQPAAVSPSAPPDALYPSYAHHEPVPAYPAPFAPSARPPRPRACRWWT